jgi:hypothetical protein
MARVIAFYVPAKFKPGTQRPKRSPEVITIRQQQRKGLQEQGLLGGAGEDVSGAASANPGLTPLSLSCFLSLD